MLREHGILYAECIESVDNLNHIYLSSAKTDASGVSRAENQTLSSC